MLQIDNELCEIVYVYTHLRNKILDESKVIRRETWEEREVETEWEVRWGMTEKERRRRRIGGDRKRGREGLGGESDEVETEERDEEEVEEKWAEVRDRDAIVNSSRCSFPWINATFFHHIN